MNVLHLTDEPWDSGLTAYALQSARLFHEKGHRVGVGVKAGKKPEAAARSMGLFTAPVDRFDQLFRLLSAEPWDVVNVHTGSMHSRAVAANILGRALPRRRTPVIVRTRGDARDVKVNPSSRWIYRRTAGVIAASGHIRRQYEEGFHIEEDRLKTVYPSVEVDEPWRKPPSNIVGIVGRLDPVKGHTHFIDAAAYVLKENPEVQFHIAGKEAGVTYALLANQARQLGIESSIRYFGHVPSAVGFMRGCSIGVISSVGSEEVSRACLEWMGVGRPVVATIVGCLGELVEPDETGLLVPPGDSRALSRAVLRILGKPDLAERMGRGASALAGRKFSGTRQYEETLSVYEAALRRG